MRPGMYVGSTDAKGLSHLIWELVDNAVDEAQVGYAHNIAVEMHRDGSVTVTDDGRGIPVDIEPSSGLSGLELVMTKLHAGGKFDTDSYAVSGGLHGVGVSIVCALSTCLQVSVWRDNKCWSMEFARGKVVKKLTSTPAPGHATGTAVRFWSDPEIFGTATFDIEQIKERCRARAYLVPGLRMRLVDERAEPSHEWVWQSETGLQDYLQHLTTYPALHTPISIEAVEHYNANTQVIKGQKAQRHLEHVTMERECQIQMALNWCEGWDHVAVSFVNMVSTPLGGSHMNGLYQGLVRAINDAARDNKVLKAKEPALTKEDICDGLVAVLQVRLPEPEFVGQTKDVLGTPQVQPLVTNVVAEAMAKWLTTAPKEQSRAVLDKVVGAARARAAARQQRDLSRKRNAIVSSSLPAKLADCRQHFPADSELLIVEGDSAAGPAKVGRNSLFQAVLPLRGKIMNAARAQASKLLADNEVASIFRCIGATPGRSFDLDDVRFSRVVLMTDADVDGLHIRCLLLALFYYQARPLLDAGRVFYAQPPLFTIRRQGQPDLYAHSDEQRDKIIASLKDSKYQVLRFKGLGEMDVEELATTCLDVETRDLHRVTLTDVEAALNMFEILMGKNVEQRLEYIVTNAPSVALEALSL